MIDAAFNKNGATMVDAAVEQAALDAAPNPSSPTAPVMRIAKDITVYAARGLGNWWVETAGVGPKLLRFAIEIARDRLGRRGQPSAVVVDPFSFWTTPFQVGPRSG